MVLYHGTDRRLRRFRFVPGMQPNTVGLWFTDSPTVAALFAARATRSPRAECGVVTADVRILRPMVYADYPAFVRAWTEYGHDASAMRHDLIRRKYDAVLVERSDTDFAHERRDYAVFNPRNIRVLSFALCERRAS
jgi:hypothetical protein